MADIKYTMPPPTEDVEQMCLFRWADAQSGKYLELSLMYHKKSADCNVGAITKSYSSHAPNLRITKREQQQETPLRQCVPPL